MPETNSAKHNPADGSSSFEGAMNPISLGLAAVVILLGAGLAIWNPWIGIPLLVLAVPALIRAFSVGIRRREEGEEPSVALRILLFFSSLGVVLLTVMAALVVFVGVCFPIGLVSFEGALDSPNSSNRDVSSFVFIGGWVLGISAGLVVGGLVAWGLWRQRI